MPGELLGSAPAVSTAIASNGIGVESSFGSLASFGPVLSPSSEISLPPVESSVSVFNPHEFINFRAFDYTPASDILEPQEDISLYETVVDSFEMSYSLERFSLNLPVSRIENPDPSLTELKEEMFLPSILSNSRPIVLDDINFPVNEGPVKRAELIDFPIEQDFSADSFDQLLEVESLLTRHYEVRGQRPHSGEVQNLEVDRSLTWFDYAHPGRQDDVLSTKELVITEPGVPDLKVDLLPEIVISKIPEHSLEVLQEVVKPEVIAKIQQAKPEVADLSVQDEVLPVVEIIDQDNSLLENLINKNQVNPIEVLIQKGIIAEPSEVVSNLNTLELAKDVAETYLKLEQVSSDDSALAVVTNLDKTKELQTTISLEKSQKQPLENPLPSGYERSAPETTARIEEAIEVIKELSETGLGTPRVRAEDVASIIDNQNSEKVSPLVKEKSLGADGSIRKIAQEVESLGETSAEYLEFKIPSIIEAHPAIKTKPDGPTVDVSDAQVQEVLQGAKNQNKVPIQKPVDLVSKRVSKLAQKSLLQTAA